MQYFISYRMRCTHHNVDLVPNHNMKGRSHDLECWPGITLFYKTMVWHLDTTELMCPLLTDDATEEQAEQCVESWDIQPWED